MGGEITWECLGNGKYKIYLKGYRECAGVQYPDTAVIKINNYPSLNQVTPVTLYKIKTIDITPTCNPIGPQIISCADANASSSANMGAMQEITFESKETYLNGMPPKEGWIFTWSSMQRVESSNILNASNSGWTLKSVMYPYDSKNSYPCYDNSPQFAENAVAVLCIGYPYTYSILGYDNDMDSLVYEWTQPLDQYFEDIFVAKPITFMPGYSYTNPLPNSSINPLNKSAVLNPTTGEITFESHTQGAFVLAVNVLSYRGGKLIAEVTREIQIILLGCGTNKPPVVDIPLISLAQGDYKLLSDTVYVGENIQYEIEVIDDDSIGNGLQNISLELISNQLGNNATDSMIGCIRPPCAYLSNTIPIIGTKKIKTTFNWHVTCNHISNYETIEEQNTYNFAIKMSDDFCPAPFRMFATLTIVVKALPALPPPKFTCLSVDTSGKTILNWEKPIDTLNSFNSYIIYTSESINGVYTPLDTILDINTTSYIHTTANAKKKPIYYYLKTTSGCYKNRVSISSDTLNSIYLDVKDLGDGNAYLQWNKPLFKQSKYHILREYPETVWSDVDSTDIENYTNSISLCNAYINYIISVNYNETCISHSNRMGKIFKDILAPVTPTFKTVSVDINLDKTILTWETSKSRDTKEYIIYKDTNGIWLNIDTVEGLQNTVFIDYNSNPSLKVEKYCLASIDSCGNTSTLNTFNQSILLNAYTDVCNELNSLNWTAYLNMTPRLLKYEVYVSENNSPYSLLAVLDNNTLSFNHENLVNNSAYNYYIKAVDTDNKLEAISNLKKTTIMLQKRPEFLYLKTASVEKENNIKIKFLADTSAFLKSFKIYRTTIYSTPDSLVKELAFSKQKPYYEFTDINVNTNSCSYYYMVSCIDSCNNEMLKSNIVRTIFLEANTNKDIENELTWNEFEGWLSESNSYSIIREIDKSNNFEVIKSVQYKLNKYYDDVEHYLNSQGNFCYYIQAIEDNDNPFGETDTALSNIACAVQSPHIFIPNAFTPLGNNPIFKPVASFIDDNNYLLRIFNRWGNIVFETTDMNQGWNGQTKKGVAPYGIYLYFLYFNDSNGKEYQFKGTITLLNIID
ncbi:MAG: hypothetical protein A2X12_00255 [Bacteroidetes bacterium GWE2_29_8]|nr:MAG: hypothetical protein A2X12_00255 [Bacteroidetes bacterium GWE2_29_8]OFY19359.1 MAG: hypothetical protein A2X02_04755 [Bacteroidetes bacterium GWF2_29_10]